MSESKSVNISLDDLKQLIQEVRKPVLTEEQIAEKKQREEDRARLGEILKQNAENKKREQEACTHMRSNGSTPCVYIANLNRLYCQHCAKWIFPEQEPDLFNKLYQLAQGIE